MFPLEPAFTLCTIIHLLEAPFNNIAAEKSWTKMYFLLELNNMFKKLCKFTKKAAHHELNDITSYSSEK